MIRKTHNKLLTEEQIEDIKKELLEPITTVIEETVLPELSDNVATVTSETIINSVSDMEPIQEKNGLKYAMNLLHEKGAALEIGTTKDRGRFTRVPQSNNPEDITIVFKNKTMSLQQFSQMTKIDSDAKLLVQSMYKLFQKDIKDGKLKNNKGDQDFTKWMLSRYGANQPREDITLSPRGNKYIILEDDAETKNTQSNWELLGFDGTFDNLIKNFNK